MSDIQNHYQHDCNANLNLEFHSNTHECEPDNCTIGDSQRVIFLIMSFDRFFSIGLENMVTWNADTGTYNGCASEFFSGSGIFLGFPIREKSGAQLLQKHEIAVIETAEADTTEPLPAVVGSIGISPTPAAACH